MNFKITNDNINLDQLVGKLQKEDLKYSKLYKGLKLTYWILIPIYATLSADNYMDTKELTDLFSGLLFVGSFLIFALTMGKFQKEYNSVDYALPSLSMLKMAANRYKPYRPKALWTVVGFFVMDAAFCLSSVHGPHFINIQGYIIAIFFASVGIGFIIWYFKYKPLRDNALRLIAEIEGE